MRIGLAQINPTVGDINGNTALISHTIDEAVQDNCDLVIFPEMAITGYPPEDLLFKKSFIDQNLTALKIIAAKAKTVQVMLGFVDVKNNKKFNSLAYLENGKIKTIYHKQELPNYGVFDEIRYFSPGNKFISIKNKALTFAPTICEDIWVDAKTLAPLKKLKPDFVVNISASPYHLNKLPLRKKVALRTANALKAPLIYCNLIGGQDELIFDGNSFVILPNGRIPIECPPFQSGLFVFDIKKEKGEFKFRSGIKKTGQKNIPLETKDALVLGIKDYVNKNGFKKVGVAVSGGIDSAVVAALAVEALGPDKVVCVTMPSQYNKNETLEDAQTLGKNLQTETLTIPIQSLLEQYLNTLENHFSGSEPNVAEENLQARIRGNIMMALSNKLGWLILTTGNKSEISTGYCTLYGDTAGGFAVLKDVLKTDVYKLAHLYLDVIPRTTLSRAPSAELRENQKDEDSLGSYDELDPIIVEYVENNKSINEIQKKTHQDIDKIKKIVSLIDRSEYKRRQAPPGIKISPRSFGRDHRMPITNRFKHL